MRTFKCYECTHIWQLPFGSGGIGASLTCPECGSTNVHRVRSESGRDDEGGRFRSSFERGRGRGWRGNR